MFGETKMRIEKFDGTISSAYGRSLATKLDFDGTYDAFGPDKDVRKYTAADWDAAVEEIRAFEGGKEFPSNEDLVNFVNNKRLANARQKAMTATLDAAGIKKPTLEDPQVRFEQMVKILTMSGQTESEAKATAAAALNYQPA